MSRVKAQLRRRLAILLSHAVGLFHAVQIIKLTPLTDTPLSVPEASCDSFTRNRVKRNEQSYFPQRWLEILFSRLDF